MKNFLFVLFTIILLVGCTDNEKETFKLESPASKVTQPAINIEQHLLQLSDELMTYLRQQEFEQFIEHVDPVDGALFSFFSDFGNPKGYGGPYVTLTKNKWPIVRLNIYGVMMRMVEHLK